jgi:hypothetical protein
MVLACKVAVFVLILVSGVRRPSDALEDHHGPACAKNLALFLTASHVAGEHGDEPSSSAAIESLADEHVPSPLHAHSQGDEGPKACAAGASSRTNSGSLGSRRRTPSLSDKRSPDWKYNGVEKFVAEGLGAEVDSGQEDDRGTRDRETCVGRKAEFELF